MGTGKRYHEVIRMLLNEVQQQKRQLGAPARSCQR